MSIEKSHYEENMDNKNIIPVSDLNRFLESDEALDFLQEVNTEMGCMDGRVMPEGALCMAGSGILLERESKDAELPKEEYIEKLVAMAKAGKLTKITWHKGHGGCGAAKIFLKANKAEFKDKDPNEDQIAEAAQQFAEKLTAEINKRLGKEAKQVICKLADAPGHHEENGVYVDMTNKMDLMPKIAQGIELPNGFILNPLLHDNMEYTAAEVEVACGIAKKHDPEGIKFNKKNKFFVKILDCKDNPMDTEKLKKTIEDKIKKNKEISNWEGMGEVVIVKTKA